MARMTGATREGGEAAVAAWPVGRAAAYQVLPGLANLMVFVPIAWLLRDTAVPSMVALFLAILLGEVPASWYLMVRGLRRDGQPVRMETLFPWRRRPGLPLLVGLGLLLALAGLVLVGGLAGAFQPALRELVFGWVPDWLVMEMGPEAVAGGSRTGLIILWALSGVVGVGVGGITQELYHRGFILPRTSRLGWGSVPLNAVLFAVVHTAAPWGWPFFFGVGLIWGAAVYHWRSVQLGLVGHIGMLALGWLGMTVMIFGRAAGA